MKNFKTATQFGLAGVVFLSSGIFLGWGKEEKPQINTDLFPHVAIIYVKI